MYMRLFHWMISEHVLPLPSEPVAFYLWNTKSVSQVAAIQFPNLPIGFLQGLPSLSPHTWVPSVCVYPLTQHLPVDNVFWNLSSEEGKTRDMG